MEPKREIVATESNVPVAVVGTGYWGKNHVRNFYELGALTHVCDTNGATLEQFEQQYPNVVATNSYDEILSNPAVRGIVVATPASTHYEVAERAIRAGKDVLVEKPLALNVADGEKLIRLASRHSAVLMVGHILLYHPAIIKLKEIIDQGELGKIQYIQSNRLSMGKVRSEENILWSFAPHDISTIIHLLEEVPTNVYATGYCHLQKDVEDVTISIMDFPSGVGAHIYVSWMNPFKEQRLVVMGDRRMAVFEDSRPDKKLRIFDNNFQWVDRRPVPVKNGEQVVEFEQAEPLKSECRHFLDCMVTRERPRSDGEEGLRTLQVLERCYRVMKNGAKPTLVATNIVSTEPEVTPTEQPVSNGFRVHETAVVDEPCSIGSKTRIWHFTHIMEEARIGENCSIGQNVLVGKGVQIGDNCKIQNNVSVYEGVTLEDYVFCGPSMVFTNVYNPRSEIPRMSELRPTLVKRGATIGANATIICGHTIGAYAFIGAGAVVLNDVADYALMVGNPAKRAGWMCRCGVQLPKSHNGDSVLACSSCGERYELRGEERIAPVAAETPITEVPLLDLKTQYRSIKDEVRSAIDRVVEDQRFILGPEVEAFEREIAEYCGSKFAIGVSSGTDALLVSLMALGVSPGDEVVTTPFTFFATVGTILRVGATPVFADIDPGTFNIDPAKLRGCITSKTKAIIPVHLFGQCAEMDPISAIARERGIPIIEDAAQAIGAKYKGRCAGNLGTLGCFSFFPSKNLGGFGDGGMVTTSDEYLADQIRIIRNQGAKPKYHHRMVGGNFRLDAIQAAVLRVKLKRLDDWSERRRANAAFYTKRLQETGLSPARVVTPTIVHQAHVFNQYVIRAEERDGLKEFLKANGVGTEIYYPSPMHLQECLMDRGHKKGDFPVTEMACQSALALPIYAELTESQKEYVVSKIGEYYGN